MAFKYGFYNAELKNGEFDRTYDAEDFGELFDGMISDGVFKGYGDAFKVTKAGPVSIYVGTGKAWFNGTWNTLDYRQTITLPSSDYLHAIVISVNKKTRTNVLTTKRFGNVAAVTLTHDEANGIFEYCLAYVRVSNGAIVSIESHIGQGSENVTPWATGLLGGGGGSSGKLEASAYTTGIDFKGTSGFDLTFKDANGLTYVNSFAITESAGKISSITNKSTGRSITISYE